RTLYRRLTPHPERWRNRELLVPLVEEILSRRTAASWAEELSAAGVPCGLIQDMKQVFERPQVQHRGLRVEIPHPAGVPCPTVASPVRLAAPPVTYALPPPALGRPT